MNDVDKKQFPKQLKMALEKYARQERLTSAEETMLEEWFAKSGKNQLLGDVLRNAEKLKKEQHVDSGETNMVWSEISEGLDKLGVGSQGRRRSLKNGLFKLFKWRKNS